MNTIRAIKIIFDLGDEIFDETKSGDESKDIILIDETDMIPN